MHENSLGRVGLHVKIRSPIVLPAVRYPSTLLTEGRHKSGVRWSERSVSLRRLSRTQNNTRFDVRPTQQPSVTHSRDQHQLFARLNRPSADDTRCNSLSPTLRRTATRTQTRQARAHCAADTLTTSCDARRTLQTSRVGSLV
jgi:hypothetical protein